MAIHNNTTLVTKAIQTSKTLQTQRSVQASEIAPVSKKTTSANVSMVLSDKQKDVLEELLGPDQPGLKQRGAVAAYQQVAQQAQREEIISSMSVHFIV